MDLLRSHPGLRTFAGGALGAATAAICSVVAFRLAMPLPSPARPHDHTREALVVVALASFLAGAFVGRRAIWARRPSELGWTLIGIYAVLLFLSSTAHLSVAEASVTIGLISVGLVVGGGVVLMISNRWHTHPKA